MGDERDMFPGLGWEKEIESLRDPHSHYKKMSVKPTKD